MTSIENIFAQAKLNIVNPPSKNHLQNSDKYGVWQEWNETFFDRFKNAFLIQIQDFVDLVIRNEQPECNLSNATNATIITTAMTTSFQTKGIVKINDVT